VTDAQLQSFLRSALYALIAAVVMAGLQFAAMLAGEGDLPWRPILATFMTVYFGALATALKSMNEPRPGSERLAAQVDALKAQGVEKSDMAVVNMFGDTSLLNEAQLRQVSDEIERRLKTQAAETVS